MPVAPPIGPSALPITAEAIDVRVTADLNQFYGRLLSESQRLLSDLSQRQLTDEELASQLESGLEENLGASMINQLGRAATAETFNLGRNIAAQEFLDVIGTAVRTEVLDRDTCDPCDGLDGTVVEMPNTADPTDLRWGRYLALMPPNGCDGNDFCRGFYLYRLR